MDESEEEEDEDYTEETALRKKRKLALFKRLKTLLWRTAAPSDASPPPEEPAQKKIKLDLTAGLQEVSDEDESEPSKCYYSANFVSHLLIYLPVDIDQSPVIIDAAQDFYDWKAIYRRAKAYESIQEAIDMAIVSHHYCVTGSLLLTLNRTATQSFWDLVYIKRAFASKNQLVSWATISRALRTRKIWRRSND